jgi:branched-subunit amino acid aminotransferase/4-amino-4-deoxychorismate lyase
MEFYLHQGKITAETDFYPKHEWMHFPVHVKTSMWFAHGEIPFLELHIEQLNKHFELLHRTYRIDRSDLNELRRLFSRLINKNKAYLGGWLHLYVFANQNNRELIAAIEKYPERQIPFDEQGKLAIISPELKWSGNTNGKSAIGMYRTWEDEKLKLAGTRYGETIFCNENGALVETIGSNLYCIRKDKLLTPSTGTGCFVDSLRQLTIESAQGLGLEVVEEEQLTPEDLPAMNEIFTVSERYGFRWIMGIGIKRFVKKKSGSIREGVEALLWKNRNDQVKTH